MIHSIFYHRTNQIILNISLFNLVIPWWKSLITPNVIIPLLALKVKKQPAISAGLVFPFNLPRHPEYAALDRCSVERPPFIKTGIHFLSIQFSFTQPFHHCRVTMIKETAGFSV